MSPLSVLTPTGARPEAFAQCVQYMRAQAYRGPVRWVVVDDGPMPEPTPYVDGWEIIHIRPWPRWEPGQNTQARNLLAGLDHVTDRVVIVEDDDAYAPWWLSACADWLEIDAMVGESHAIYHHTNGAVRECGNDAHASLCSTALAGSAINDLRLICETQKKAIDFTLWKSRPGRLYPPEPRGVTGIKGYPGRPGIGAGHRMRAPA